MSNTYIDGQLSPKIRASNIRMEVELGVGNNVARTEKKKKKHMKRLDRTSYTRQRLLYKQGTVFIQTYASGETDAATTSHPGNSGKSTHFYWLRNWLGSMHSTTNRVRQRAKPENSLLMTLTTWHSPEVCQGGGQNTI